MQQITNNIQMCEGAFGWLYILAFSQAAQGTENRSLCVLGRVLVDRMYTTTANASLALLHFGVICYVVLVTGTNTFFHQLCWKLCLAFTFKNERMET